MFCDMGCNGKRPVSKLSVLYKGDAGRLGTHKQRVLPSVLERRLPAHATAFHHLGYLTTVFFEIEKLAGTQSLRLTQVQLRRRAWADSQAYLCGLCGRYSASASPPRGKSTVFVFHRVEILPSDKASAHPDSCSGQRDVKAWRSDEGTRCHMCALPRTGRQRRFLTACFVSSTGTGGH